MTVYNQHKNILPISSILLFVHILLAMGFFLWEARIFVFSSFSWKVPYQWSNSLHHSTYETKPNRISDIQNLLQDLFCCCWI